MSLSSFWEFPAFAILGIVSALAAIAFMWSVIFAEDSFQKLKVPYWAKPMIGGLALGVIALIFPQILGVGYEATDAALSEIYPLSVLLALIVFENAGDLDLSWVWFFRWCIFPFIVSWCHGGWGLWYYCNQYFSGSFIWNGGLYCYWHGRCCRCCSWRADFYYLDDF